MVDMINHSSEPNVDISFDDDGNCLVTTLYDIPAGSALTISLGDPTNPWVSSALFCANALSFFVYVWSDHSYYLRINQYAHLRAIRVLTVGLHNDLLQSSSSGQADKGAWVRLQRFTYRDTNWRGCAKGKLYLDCRLWLIVLRLTDATLKGLGHLSLWVTAIQRWRSCRKVLCGMSNEWHWNEGTVS